MPIPIDSTAAYADAAEAWFAENDPEGVAFEQKVIKPPSELLAIWILIVPQHGSIQALTEFHFRLGANR